MTKAEQAIREFAEKWGFSQDKTDEGFLIDNDRTKECLSDLTALIEEHYYPKDFMVWAFQKCPFYIGENARRNIIALNPNNGKQFNLDELYQYWKENVR